MRTASPHTLFYTLFEISTRIRNADATVVRADRMCQWWNGKVAARHPARRPEPPLSGPDAPGGDRGGRVPAAGSGGAGRGPRGGPEPRPPRRGAVGSRPARASCARP
ncbi:hypothetical protein GCM10027168_48110 [Streptomyces capparidis]